MTKTGGVYARISKADKSVPKTEIQVQICLALAEEEGVTVDPRHIFMDDGIAASGRNIDDTTLENRPAAKRALAAMRGAEFNVLYAVEGERLARTYLDGLQFIQASAAGGVTWHLDTDGPLNPSTPAGEETAVSIFASGRREGRIRTARQKRRYDRELASGMPLWNTRPFGYEDRIHVRESEAVHIRQAVRDYLAGTASMTAIAHRWNAAGIKTDGMTRPRRRRGDEPGSEQKEPLYSYWTTTTVQKLLLRERNAGILMNNGAEMPNSQIEPIFSRAEHEDLKARVKVGTPMGARARSLLGGVLRCECGKPMHKSVSYSQRKGGPRNVYDIYRCTAYAFDKTAKHANINARIADEAVSRQVLSYLALGAVSQAEAPTYGARINEIAERLNALTDQEERAEEALIEGLGNKARVKGKLEAIRAERADLADERDRLEADRVGGDVFRVIEQMQEVIQAVAWGPDTPLSELEEWALTEIWNAWSEVPIEDVQALIRGKFVCVVVVGGRGAERITVIPGRILSGDASAR